MLYAEDFDSKFGFSDGEAIPPDALAYREVYCRLINAMAEAKGSKVRVLPFNRSGAHNWCMWVMVTAKFYNTLTRKQQLSGDVEWPEEANVTVNDTDEAWDDVLDDVEDLCLDTYVRSTVTIDEKRLKNTLAEIKCSKEDK